MGDLPADSASSGGIKPSVQQRLEFLDFRLQWSGRFNRKDLSDQFRISPQQASADIALYESHAPGNARYDTTQKSYVRSETFSPAFVGEFSDRYLLQLVGLKNGWVTEETSWLEHIPPFDIVSLKHAVDASHLRNVIDAIRDKLELQIEYSSLHSGELASRWIAPHAIAYSFGRWHARAWSRERSDFRDFNINRIRRILDRRSASVDAGLDYQWHNYVDLVLKANDQLTPGVRQAVEAEYNMKNGQIVTSVRLSLVFYLLAEHNLDARPGELRPEKQQLVLVNLEEVESAVRYAGKMSVDALARSSNK